ncbi:type II toxin-antitoxin system PemK/MazF family toxin [Fusobacterium polymorphum]
MYFVDLGYNYGSELRNSHYCVVSASQGKVATVIPLTSKIPLIPK